MLPLYKTKRKREWIEVFDGGREVLNLKTKKGRDIYAQRFNKAFDDQNGLCGICGDPMDYSDAVPDHKKAKGMGGAMHDDRQENIQAAHSLCNLVKGSRGPDFKITKVPMSTGDEA